jgi:NAD(P)-dependent dehydrogenase (short-subunit alcohol dehydrogenase family)
MNTDRSAIVTGASRGLGRAIARALARDGWSLVLDARGPTALHAIYEELSPLTTVAAVAGDIADADHRAALIAAVRNLPGRAGPAGRGGSLDLIVNNASILGPSPQPTLSAYPLETLEEVYRVNVIGPLGLIQNALPLMGAAGVIINITSDAAVEGYEGWGGYGSSKAALEQISNVLGTENSHLRVYWVDPGDMNTQMHQEAFPGEDISDRPPPEDSVPGILRLVGGDLPSGRYRARQLASIEAGAR